MAGGKPPSPFPGRLVVIAGRPVVGAIPRSMERVGRPGGSRQEHGTRGEAAALALANGQGRAVVPVHPPYHDGTRMRVELRYGRVSSVLRDRRVLPGGTGILTYCPVTCCICLHTSGEI